ncbi:unnamed protein product [Blepharisma stoltei]|uniref:Uncharacterized protein n=1 Tax=Blepharisma stoltei TaxID=1481888 RepID=A0AAU9IZ14_9CILI|nr:unnamed protein product [Blepharisma stoltei]
MAYEENKRVLHVRTPVVLEEQEINTEPNASLCTKSVFPKYDSFSQKFPCLRSNAVNPDKKSSQIFQRSAENIHINNKSRYQSPLSIGSRKKWSPSPIRDCESDLELTFFQRSIVPRKDSRLRAHPISEISLEVPIIEAAPNPSARSKDLNSIKNWKAQQSSSHKRIRSNEPKRGSVKVLRKRASTPLKVQCNNLYNIHIKIQERQITPVHLDYVTQIMKRPWLST